MTRRSRGISDARIKTLAFNIPAAIHDVKNAASEGPRVIGHVDCHPLFPDDGGLCPWRRRAEQGIKECCRGPDRLHGHVAVAAELDVNSFLVADLATCPQID